MPPGRRNDMFFGRNPGHIIIIYPAFTGFPVAQASFSVFLTAFFIERSLVCMFSDDSGMRYALSDLSDVVPHPQSSDSSFGKRLERGFGLLFPGQLIPDTAAQTRRLRSFPCFWAGPSFF